MNYGKRKLSASAASLGNDDVGSSSEAVEDTAKRRFRNLNEKKRRDQFNQLLNELGAMVCSSEAKRVDKTTVLEQTLQFLQKHQAAETDQSESFSYKWKPSFLSPDEFSYLLLEAMDCATMGLDSTGTLQSLSDNSVNKLNLSKDAVNTRRQLRDFFCDPNEADRLLNTSRKYSDKVTRVETLFTSDELELDAARRYQLVDILCVPSSESNYPMNNNEKYNCIVQLKTPSAAKEFSGSSDMTFEGKYSIDWKILHIDNKASSVLGYQPFEILGSSGYDYYHPQDIEYIAAAQKKLLQTGCCKTLYHRMRTKSQGWVWLQTELYTCYNHWSSKIEHIQGIHSIAKVDDVDTFLQTGAALLLSSTAAEDTTRSVKRQRLHDNSSSVRSDDGNSILDADGSPKHLSRIGLKQKREVVCRRLPQDDHHSTAFRGGITPPGHQELITPKHLNPAQMRLHGQLQDKYKNLKAALEKQQQDLTQLLRHLNIAATMKPTATDMSTLSPPPISSWGQSSQQQISSQAQPSPNIPSINIQPASSNSMGYSPMLSQPAPDSMSIPTNPPQLVPNDAMGYSPNPMQTGYSDGMGYNPSSMQPVPGDSMGYNPMVNEMAQYNYGLEAQALGDELTRDTDSNSRYHVAYRERDKCAQQ